MIICPENPKLEEKKIGQKYPALYTQNMFLLFPAILSHHKGAVFE